MSSRLLLLLASVVLSLASVVGAGCDGAVDPELPDCQLVESPVSRPTPPERPAEVDYLVIAADQLVSVGEEHAAYRDTVGHRSEVLALSDVLDDGSGGVDVEGAIDRIREAIRARHDALDDDRTLFVLLLGDATEGWSGDTSEVPAAEVGGWMWEGDATSDNAVADLDGDELPDVALGRVPASDPDVAGAILERTRELEGSYEPGPWARLAHVFASEAGFGSVIDSVIEEAGFAAVEEVPYDWGLSFTYARADSPYAYPPAAFSDQVYGLLNSGSLFVAYIGHGWEEGFTSVDWEGERAPILDTSHLDRLDMQHRVPLLVFIACLTGSFDTGDSLSEQFLAQAGGPAVILASSEISHPFPNGVMIRELGQTMLVHRLRTVGEVVMEGKRRMVTAADDPVRVDLDALAGVDESTSTAEQRDELLLQHEHMYVLFGDPAHVVAYPAGTVEVELEADDLVAGEDVRACVQVLGPPAGHALVTLETDRDVIGYNLPAWEMDDPDRDEVVLSNYALANDKVTELWEGDYEGGGFGVALPTSTAHTGTLHLRVYVWQDEIDAVGSAGLRVRAPVEED